jgi:hypothetical protein
VAALMRIAQSTTGIAEAAEVAVPVGHAARPRALACSGELPARSVRGDRAAARRAQRSTAVPAAAVHRHLRQHDQLGRLQRGARTGDLRSTYRAFRLAPPCVLAIGIIPATLGELLLPALRGRSSCQRGRWSRSSCRSTGAPIR